MGYYIVSENGTGEDKKQHLVQAKNQAAALKAIVEPRFSVETATIQDAVNLTAKGVNVVEA